MISLTFDDWANLENTLGKLFGDIFVLAIVIWFGATIGRALGEQIELWLCKYFKLRPHDSTQELLDRLESIEFAIREK